MLLLLVIQILCLSVALANHNYVQHRLYNRRGHHHHHDHESNNIDREVTDGRVNKFCDHQPEGVYSMGACKNFYALCDSRGRLSVSMCPRDQLYRPEEQQCVDREMEPRCAEIAYARDHHLCPTDRGQDESMLAFEECSNEYGLCYGGTLYYVRCPREEQAFSREQGSCVERSQLAACHSSGEEKGTPTAEGIDQGHPGHPSCDCDHCKNVLGCSTQPKTSAFTKWSLHAPCLRNPNIQRAPIGMCYRDFVICDREGIYSDEYYARCDADQVAEGPGAVCIPKSQSLECPENWPSPLGSGESEAAKFVHEITTILKSIDFCRSRSYFFYANPLDDKTASKDGTCRRAVISCLHGEPAFHLCPPMQAFDPNEGTCVQRSFCPADQHFHDWFRRYLSWLTAALHLCHEHEVNGVHSFGQCTNFYGRCHLGTFQIESCQDPDRDVYDPKEDRCRPAEELDQCRRENPNPPPPVVKSRCHDPNEHDRLRSIGGKCSPHFSVCLGDWAETESKCDGLGYAFDESKQQCVPNEIHPECPEYKEKEPEVVTEEPEEPKEVPTGKDVDYRRGTCKGDGGFHVHPTDCAKFYRCAHGKLVEMPCPPGTAFDPSINVCNHKHMVKRCHE